MKKPMIFSIVIVLSVLFLLTSCRPPEIEGIVVNMQQGLYDKAFGLAEEAVQKYPNNPEAWYLMGTLYGQKENFEQMNECFDKSLAIGSKFKGDIERERFNYFVENYNDAINNYFRRARDEQNEENQKKLYTAASEKLLKAHLADPTRNEPMTPMALSFLEIGDTTTAVKYMSKAVEMQPKNDTLMVSVGDFYYRINRVNDAKSLYENALLINPDNTQAHLALGQVYSDQGNSDKAIEQFDIAAKADPNNSAIPFNIAIILYNIQKYDEALPYIKKTLELDPQNKDMTELMSISYIQLAQKEMDKFSESENAADKAAAMKIYDQAIIFLEDAITRFPNSPLLWNNLGVCYAQKGLKDKAEDAFKKQKELEEN
jgi:tetratricopeptide (TPR) repeat protein